MNKPTRLRGSTVQSALAQGHGETNDFHSSDKHLLPGNTVQSCPGVISVAVIKYPDDKLLQRERVCLVFSSRWLFITAGKSRQLFRAPSCITFKSREREGMHTCMPTCLLLSLCLFVCPTLSQFRTQPLGQPSHPTFPVDLPTSYRKFPHRPAYRPTWSRHTSLSFWVMSAWQWVRWPSPTGLLRP